MVVKQLGMSLIKMDKPQDAVRFMDETDVNLVMDSRLSARECQVGVYLKGPCGLKNLHRLPAVRPEPLQGWPRLMPESNTEMTKYMQ